jgi:peptidoglycan LD-endopeptidase CwlK
MPSFSKESLQRLGTCHPDLQILMQESIKIYDFKVLYGYRSPEEQHNLYTQGRKLVGNKWVKVGSTVTDKDGYMKKSNHNFTPAHAVDIAPFPIDWKNLDEFKKMAGIVLGVADRLYRDGKITHRIKWGGSWISFKDYPHFEIIGS